jgi:hypothetical protein
LYHGLGKGDLARFCIGLAIARIDGSGVFSTSVDPTILSRIGALLASILILGLDEKDGLSGFGVSVGVGVWDGLGSCVGLDV